MNEEVIKSFLVSIGYQTDETSLRKFTLSLESVTKKVMALGVGVAATAVAVVTGVKIISGEMERLYYASQRTGETVGNIMALRYAAGQIGLTADQAQASLEGFTRTLRLNPGMNGLLSQLGVTGKGPLEQFESFISKMRQMKPYIAAQYAALFGIDPDTLLMLEQGQEKRLAAEEKYRQKLSANHIDPDRAADAGRQFDNSIRDITDDIHLFWVLLQEHLAPVLTTIAERFAKWEQAHADKVAGRIATALEAVAKWVSEVDWDEVGNDVDVFLSKAWEVAKVIGNIIGSFAKAAEFLGIAPKTKHGDPNNGGFVPDGSIVEQGDPKNGGFVPDGSIVDENAASSGGSDSPPDADPNDSPFIAWVRRKRWAYQKWVGGASAGAQRPDQGALDFGNGSKSWSAPRGIRNNNPGNIEYGRFARSVGATGTDGRFAVFETMEDGIRAAVALLQSYAARGIDTVETIISRWAPSKDGNNTKAYIDAVAKQLGVSPDARLSADQLSGVANAIFKHENGSAFGKLGVDSPSAASKSVTVSQKTDIHVHGSPDPHGTGRSVASEQTRVNADLVRNMTGAYV